MNLLKYCFFFLFLAGMSACGTIQENTTEDSTSDIAAMVAKIPISITIDRLDSLLIRCQTPAQIISFIQQNPSVSSQYFGVQARNEKTFISNLSATIQNPDFQNFYQKSIEKLGRLDSLKQEFHSAFQYIKYYYPTFKEPRIVLMFTGFQGPDITISDSLIVIGIDYFLGKKASFRPNVYDYQLGRYDMNHLVPSVIFLLSKKYIAYNTNDNTLLAEMLRWGKGFAFVSAMMPQTPDSLIIGYTEQQLDETAFAQDLVWEHFISQKLLYQTDDFKKQKYVGERPSTPEIGPRCPGSIGWWLGWKIVQKYMDNNPDVPLPAFLQNTNAQQILEKSNYHGEVDV